MPCSHPKPATQTPRDIIFWLWSCVGTSRRSFIIPDSMLCIMSIGVPLYGSKSLNLRKTESTICTECRLPAAADSEFCDVCGISARYLLTVLVPRSHSSGPQQTSHFFDMVLNEPGMPQIKRRREVVHHVSRRQTLVARISCHHRVQHPCIIRKGI